MHTGELVCVCVCVCVCIRSADAKAAAIKQLSAGAAPVKLPLPPADQVLNLIKTRRSIFPKDYTGTCVFSRLM